MTNPKRNNIGAFGQQLGTLSIFQVEEAWVPVKSFGFLDIF